MFAWKKSWVEILIDKIAYGFFYLPPVIQWHNRFCGVLRPFAKEIASYFPETWGKLASVCVLQ